MEGRLWVRWVGLRWDMQAEIMKGVFNMKKCVVDMKLHHSIGRRGVMQNCPAMPAGVEVDVYRFTWVQVSHFTWIPRPESMAASSQRLYCKEGPYQDRPPLCPFRL